MPDSARRKLRLRSPIALAAFIRRISRVVLFAALLAPAHAHKSPYGLFVIFFEISQEVKGSAPALGGAI
jgi:hypothetical protein